MSNQPFCCQGLFVRLTLVILLQIASINAQDAPVPADEVVFVEQLDFETTIMTADTNPTLAGEVTSTEQAELLNPVWWDTMQSSFSEKDTNLQRCFKRSDTPPTHGSSCSDKRKSCLFGTQTCPDGAQFPEMHCMCTDGVWICSYHNCPHCPDKAPSSAASGDGEVLKCPAEGRLTCNYNRQQWYVRNYSSY